MTKRYCDICHAAMKSHEVRFPSESLRHIVGVYEICTQCADKLNSTNWGKMIRAVVRGEAVGTPCDACRWSPPSSADGKPCAICPADKKI